MVVPCMLLRANVWSILPGHRRCCEDAMRSALFLTVLSACLLVCACAGRQTSSLPQETAASPGSASATLIGDYRPALQAHPDDYVAFMKAWLGETIPELESSQFV